MRSMRPMNPCTAMAAALPSKPALMEAEAASHIEVPLARA